jgi:hypothetical protein
MTPPATRLLELLAGAPRMPFLRGVVRVDKHEVQALVAEVRESAAAEPRLIRAAAAADEAVRHARPVSLSDEVRLRRDVVEGLVAELRAAGA